ncbi:MAG: hypothetical protein AB8B55_07915 [Mariniblastus sp.]
MLIEIQCGNFSNFDASTGTYLTCAEKQIVSSDLAGTNVKCKKCGQDVEVPFDIGTTKKRESKPAAPAEAPRAKRTREKGEARGQKTRKPRTDGSAGQRRARNPGEAQSKQRPGRSKPATAKAQKLKTSGSKRRADPTDELSLAAPTIRPKSDVMGMDFGDSSTVARAKTERCKKCGNESVDGRCSVCKHVEPKFEKMNQSIQDIEIENVGFQRWFCETMNEGVSIKVLEYASHIMLGFLGLLLVGAGIICLTGLGLGVFGGVVILTGVGLATALYCGLVFKGYQFQNDPRARLAWFQKPFWNFILMVARLMKWQAYDSRLKGRTIIRSRDKMFGDYELADHPDLKNCSVLDLQGTRVTDRGLLELYRLKHLRCVVLRKTSVSHEAIFRLQQSLPRLWIWY